MKRRDFFGAIAALQAATVLQVGAQALRLAIPPSLRQRADEVNS